MPWSTRSVRSRRRARPRRRQPRLRRSGEPQRLSDFGTCFVEALPEGSVRQKRIGNVSADLLARHEVAGIMEAANQPALAIACDALRELVLQLRGSIAEQCGIECGSRGMAGGEGGPFRPAAGAG